MLLKSLTDSRGGVGASKSALADVLDSLPIAVMTCTPGDQRVTSVNRAMRACLDGLAAHLPCASGEVVGRPLHELLPGFERLAPVLSHPHHLPHVTEIAAGPERFRIRASAVFDASGRYCGASLIWTPLSRAADAPDPNDIVAPATEIGASAARVRAGASSLSETAERTREMASSLSAETERLGDAAQEIGRRVSRSLGLAGRAGEGAQTSAAAMSALEAAAERVGDAVARVHDIAEQTNLLAINATIEATRAGEGGRGFAVMAREVKALSDQVSAATGEIGGLVRKIRESAGTVTADLASVSRSVHDLEETAAAVSRVIEDHQTSARKLATNMRDISQASGETGRAAHEVSRAAQGLSGWVERLDAAVNKVPPVPRAS